ncbi:MAG TPA: YdcF family protein [Thermodesulfobacteriota bacterium]
MLFVASKLFWAVAQPAALLLAGLLAGAALLYTRWRAAGRVVVTVTAAAALALTVTPLGPWLLRPLEDRFPRPERLPARVDGIVVLGGAADPWVSRARGQPNVGASADRLIAGAMLARRYPDAKVLFTGGSARIGGGPDEAAPSRAILEALGVAPERLLVENRSRNTWENVRLSYPLANPTPGETWILVTSASHMPRAVGIFRRVGWPVIPYPVDYETTGDPSPPPPYSLREGLDLASIALQEWYGLVAYRLLGRTDRLFPGPEDR